MKKSTHSKIKNTAILFELLTRQVAADTMKGVDQSPALSIIKEFFKADSALAKELMLYQTLQNEKYNTQAKADYLIDSVTKLHKKLNKEFLNKTKYKLISEVKKHYNVLSFFKTNISEYKIFAATYRLFEGTSVARVAEVVQSRYTLAEHITRKPGVKSDNSTVMLEFYNKQDEDVRLLAYKLMIDKFNEKYADLSPKQKAILKEYINNISNTEGLKLYAIAESKQIKKAISSELPRVKDKITVIKLHEVINILGKFETLKAIKENHILSLLLYRELIKELKNVK